MATLWSRFRKFCGTAFLGPKDLLAKLQGLRLESEDEEKRSNQRKQDFGLSTSSSMPLAARMGGQHGPLVVDQRQWEGSLPRCGWVGGHERLLFEALDLHDEGLLGQRNFFWLDQEVRRYALKCEAKQKASEDHRVRVAARKNRQRALSDFKAYVKRHFGDSYHAWRRALDVDGTMNLQRAELFKVCRHLGWKGDVRLLWQALDSDGAGTCSLQELDARCARQLARFRRWAEVKFGIRPAHALWKAVDRRNKYRLSPETFQKECLRLGVEFQEQELSELTRWLDWQEKKALTLDDLLFMDIWKPPAYLVAEPNPEAATQIRTLLKEKYGHLLRAWRQAMDKDNSNTCNWYEFLAASRSLKFAGDVAGAWLHFDKDLSGSISLAEIDPQSNDMLVEFKKWADGEFGGVRAAFRVLDKDKSGQLSISEFRVSVLSFGFTGDEVTLFRCLDSGQGRLHPHEVHFLDDWDTASQDASEPSVDSLPARPRSQGGWSRATVRRPETSMQESIVEFYTDGPGPGSYELPSAFAAKPKTPTARHSGTWSFCRRPEAAWLQQLKSVGPEAGASPAQPRRRPPSWTFARGPRMGAGRVASPGPGSYEAQAPAAQAPKFTMGIRRMARMHPMASPRLTYPGSSVEKKMVYSC
ncbi:unnamed protein product [Symbiodinium natans]|uniref:EF-hand domain-containing protein n=1 Tax=Symbiodinium natans TaxID=878477 RepID=A0A812R509_9DINO|nr:unnamed protein product [Symbiodinium natans]